MRLITSWCARLWRNCATDKQLRFRCTTFALTRGTYIWTVELVCWYMTRWRPRVAAVAVSDGLPLFLYRLTRTQHVYGADVILFEGILTFYDKVIRHWYAIRRSLWLCSHSWPLGPARNRRRTFLCNSWCYLDSKWCCTFSLHARA